jgi:NTE family protein
MQHELPNTGIILTGGGARAAYQVGVLKAIYQLTPKGSHHPFPIICGSSAGAINAASIACYAGQYRAGLRRLEAIWSNLTVDQVFKSGISNLLGQSLGFVWHLLSGSRNSRYTALLNNEPLRQLLTKALPMERISQLIEEGLIKGLNITCSDYYSGHSYSFFQSAGDIKPWRRHRRLGVPCDIGIDHMMASSAIPFLFPAVEINAQYFGDGTVGDMSPISPAIHLGAERIMIVGLDQLNTTEEMICYDKPPPGFSEVAGHILDSVFIDSLNSDLERLERVNQTLASVPEELMKQVDLPLKKITTLVISPSENLADIANKYAKEIPATTRFFLSRLGVDFSEGSQLLSYVLFEGAYCRHLIELGYRDTLDRESEIEAFFQFDQ